MRLACLVVATILSVFGSSSSSGAQRGPAPELLACGDHDRLEIICGTSGPEDLELTPDGAYLIVSQFSTNGSTGRGLFLFDLAGDSFTPIRTTADRRNGWGDLACPGPMTEPIVPHGISLGLHPDGVRALYVVNHGGRETIEMFELRQTANSWQLVWHGCTPASRAYNDVAILPDGGYVATRPTALQQDGDGGDLFAGRPSGNVARWIPGEGERELPDTEGPYPNGVVADPDGQYIYIALWTGRGLRKYDLDAMRTVSSADLDFMPDNLTWTPDGELLAAGITGLGPRGGFAIARVSPDTLTSQDVYQSTEIPAPVTGVSVALEVEGNMYVGAYQGDRLIRVRP